MYARSSAYFNKTGWHHDFKPSDTVAMGIFIITTIRNHFLGHSSST